ncbi:LysR substrate-binding domain-containing protein [Roseateles amylovorans]|uniref:LysR substrate-binding domain-containing protein n=1 Tax=Roseateles amylovorans TaxID=2978473 RepID=A0ABY6B5K4_9BURK|nr:LysR substrate-binding domain-containing protein [Roseateles amylovorans]UXH80132.1 LysR substrate-binding domain-containing protein [Roseateles amylovorans]
MIELRPLRQFLVLAEELHFGRAAERLHMTQPPLSLAVQKLEAQLGAQLLSRGSRTVALTAAGQALVEASGRLVELADQIPARVRAAHSGEAGRLNLGFVSTVGFGDMPRWLRLFREALPGVSFNLKEATLDVQLRGFDSGELDAGFVIHAPGAAPDGFRRLRVSREPLVLAHAQAWSLGTVATTIGTSLGHTANTELTTNAHRTDAPKGSDEARRRTIDPRPAKSGLRRTARSAREAGPSLAEVLQLPLVVFPREIAPSLFDALLGFYRAHGATPQIAQEAIQMQTIVNLVSAGMGVAWVPASVCALQRPGVRYHPWPGVRVPSCETSLIWREDAPPVVQRFVAHVREQIAHAGDSDEREVQ